MTERPTLPDAMFAPEPHGLQMIRAEVQLRELQRWMGSRRLDDHDHAVHCLLVESFGDLAPKPFRLISPRSGALGVLYGYGRSTAAVLREQAEICADPLQARVIPVAGIDSKPMPVQRHSGRRLGFEVRVRPVVRQGRHGSDQVGGERDAFQVETMRHPSRAMPRDREAVYVDWLSDELDRRGGVVLDRKRTQLISFRRVRSQYQQRGQRSEGPDAIMRGSLTITEPEPFVSLLARGIGRHRAYGYGMLLLRPAKR